VLITLSIIGVIAAITIPSIVANHQKRELEVRFAKSYRTAMHAVNMSIAENGGIETWEWVDETLVPNDYSIEIVKKYFLPYLNVAKFCPDANTRGCFPDVVYKVGGTGNDWSNLDIRNNPKVLLADGSSIAFNFAAKCLTNGNRCLILQIDTNGARKPNVVGYDLHEINFYPQTGEILPAGVYKNNSYNEDTKSFYRYSEEESRSMCKADGFYCSGIVIQDGFKINY